MSSSSSFDHHITDHQLTTPPSPSTVPSFNLAQLPVNVVDMSKKSQQDPLIGKRAPDLTLTREDGTQYTLPVGQRVRIRWVVTLQLHSTKLVRVYPWSRFDIHARPRLREKSQHGQKLTLPKPIALFFVSLNESTRVSLSRLLWTPDAPPHHWFS